MKETEAHKRAFKFWYDLGVTRSYPQVASKLSVSVTSIKKWAKAHGWVERARLQDLEHTKNELKELSNQKIKQDKEKESLSVKDAYRKDIDNTLKIIKATILSAINKDTKKLNVKAETPGDINALATAYEKLAKLDILLSEDDVPEVENAIQLQTDIPVLKEKPKYPIGRRPKLTTELQERLLKDIRNNMTIKRACLRNRITTQTLFNWKRAGEVERDRIVQGVEKAKKIAIKDGTLNPSDLLAIEDFVIDTINKLKPNLYFTFLIEAQKADADAEAKNLEAIRLARDGGEYVSETHLIKNSKGIVTGRKEIKKYMQPAWTSAAWLLERKYPDLYGKHVKYDGILDAHITGENGGNGKNIAEQKDEMQGKRRVAELALALMRLAAQSKMLVAPGVENEPVIDAG